MFSFQPVFILYVSHSKFIKTTTSPFYSSLPKFSPVPEDWLCSPMILPLAHQSQSIVLINTYLDLCNRGFVFSSAPVSPIFHSKHYITDKIFRSVISASESLLHILITNWVTYKLRALSFLDLASSFILPVIFVSLECIRRSPYLFTSQVSTSDLLRTSFSYSTIQIPHFLMGLIQPFLPRWSFPRACLSFSAMS